MTFLRYIAVQLVAYGIDMSVFLAVLFSGALGPVETNVIAKLSAGLFAFVAHRQFTFRVAESIAAKEQAIRYFVLLALNVPVASVILTFLLLWIPEPVMAKFIADVICVGLTYLLSKHFIFFGQQASLKKADSTESGL